MSNDEHHHRGSGNLQIALYLNLLFVLLEVVGGLWTNSIAILSDALHDAGDCASLGLAWHLEKLSRRCPDATFTYGYRRFSVLGALITGLVLTAGLSIVVWTATRRVLQPEEMKVHGMLAIAVAGILLNGIAAWMLHGGHSLNEKVASWHLLEDTLGWAAVLVGSVVMMIWHLPVVDPILAILISAIVLWNVFRNLKRAALVFLQSAPPGFDVEDFERTLLKLPGLIGVHHTQTWTLDGESHVLSTHLVMSRKSGREDIIAVKCQVHDLLRDQHFHNITLDVELEGESCAADQGQSVS